MSILHRGGGDGGTRGASDFPDDRGAKRDTTSRRVTTATAIQADSLLVNGDYIRILEHPSESGTLQTRRMLSRVTRYRGET